MKETPEYIGLIRYKGKPLKDGYFDARKSAQALLGFDEALRFFVGKQDSELSKIDYEIPVRIRKGTWEALIPQDIATYIKPVLILIATAYAASAAGKMAQNDFKNVGFVSLFKKAIQAMQWVLKIGKHLGSLTKQSLKQSYEKMKFRKNNTEIGIQNNDGEYLYVPKMFLDYIEHMPANILDKLASLVTEKIELEVVVYDEKKDVSESLGMTHKNIFCPEVEELILPELKHGEEVKLKGHVTRGNEPQNSIGLFYKDHILTCIPKEGSIVRFKSSLYVESEIIGVITREDKFGKITEKKPKIKFSELKPLERDISEKPQPGLFDDKG